MIIGWVLPLAANRRASSSRSSGGKLKAVRVSSGLSMERTLPRRRPGTSIGPSKKRGGIVLDTAPVDRELAAYPVLRMLPSMSATTYQYLMRIPGVCAGRTLVEGTRIGVHDVVGLIVNGATVDDVCRSYPALTRAQVYACLAYYEDHRAEIDSLVAEQMAADLQ